MTPRASDDLCRRVAEQSDGVCLLGFSRGKDSCAAFLQLRRYFTRVVPFHVATAPHLSFSDEALAYYEAYFGTPIHRFMDGENLGGIADMVFQPLEDEPAIEALDLWVYNKHDLANLVRKKEGLPRAWCAWGIAASDSIDRRVRVTQGGGQIASARSFYPCFDWSRAEILAIIDEAGLKLPRDYLMANRTLAGLPGIRHLEKLEELFPEDFATLEAMFPFIKAIVARNEFRKRHLG